MHLDPACRHNLKMIVGVMKAELHNAVTKLVDPLIAFIRGWLHHHA